MNLFEAAEYYLDSMRLSEALTSFTLAEAQGFDPDRCAAGRWQCHMLSGNFECAWVESDRISRRGGPDPHRFWNGEPLDGNSILIRCLHGLGDTIQFVRYGALIRSKAKHLVIEAQPRLKTLLQYSGLADEVITWGEKEPPWNQQIEINELPRIFRTVADTIPSCVPYLKAPTEVKPPFYDGDRHLRVGLVWTAGAFNPSRSISLDLFEKVLATPGADFFSLQGEPNDEELARLRARLFHLDENSRGLLATAEHVLSMDLIITVDTMMAHLAGALGRPVWNLLPYRCDWRWMADRPDSPWYPTMRLFRQPRQGDWVGVVENVRRRLRLVLESKVYRCTNGRNARNRCI
jgi:hypothetical protein